VSDVVTSLAGSTENLGRFAVAVPGVAEWVGGMIPPGSSHWVNVAALLVLFAVYTALSTRVFRWE
jgi:hypothetical protein